MSRAGGNGDSGSSWPSVSGDGRYVAFSSYASNLVAGDTNGTSDIFVCDLLTGRTRRVSAASDGAQANGGSFDPSISADGNVVAFQSDATNLVAGDTEGHIDVFVHVISTGVTERVSVSPRGRGANSAERLALEGEELGAAEDVVNFAYGRALRARLAADQGEHAEAERLARSGLEYAYKTDFPSVHARAHDALAHVLASTGQTKDARGELEVAVELWTRYGFQVLEERGRARLAQL